MAGKSTVKVHVKADIAHFQRAMKKLGDTTGVTNLASGVKKLGSQFASVAKYAGTATVALGGVAVKAAADLEQSAGAVKDVFKQYASTVENYSKKASTAVGLSANSYNELATLLGTQLKNGGTAINQIAGKTNELIKLGADLAAGFGGTTADAVRALSSALKGERDPIEKYGVSLTQAAIDAEAARLGFEKVGGALSSQASQAATLSLIMQQTSDFHGKFAAENDTLAHKAQVVKAKLADMAATLGSSLLPIVSQVVEYFDANLMPIMQQFLAWISDNAIPKIKQLAGSFTTNWLPALKEMGTAIAGTVIPAISQLIGWISQNSAVLIPLAAGILSAVTAWRAYQQVMQIIQATTAVINIIKTAVNGWRVATEGMTVAQKALNLVQKASPWGMIITAVTTVITVIVTLWQTNDKFRNAILSAWNALKAGFSAIVSWFRTLPATFVNIVSNIGSGIKNGFNSVVNFMRSIPSRILGALGNLGNLLWNAGKSVIQGFLNGIKSMWGSVKAKLQELTSWLPDWKGPKDKDRTILRDSGRLVIGGFIDGLEDKYKNVRQSLQEFTRSLDGAISMPAYAYPNSGFAGYTPAPIYQISVNALAPSPEIGRQVVNAIKQYEAAGGRR